MHIVTLFDFNSDCASRLAHGSWVTLHYQPKPVAAAKGYCDLGCISATCSYS